VLGTTPPAAATAFGSGCPGSRGVPRLAAFGRPVSGNAGFGLDLCSARAGAVFAHHFSANAGAIALGGGCDLLFDPPTLLAVVGGVTGPAGFAATPLPLPLGLPPLSFVVQSVVVDPAGPVLGVAVSPGLTVDLGS
jgi:hypothetical protein